MLKDSILKMLKLDGLINNLTGFVEARIELMRLELKEDIAKALSKILISIILAFVFVLFIALFSMAVAYKIGESLGNFGGFTVVAVFYLVLGLVLLAFRNSFTAKVEGQLTELMKKKKK